MLSLINNQSLVTNNRIPWMVLSLSHHNLLTVTFGLEPFQRVWFPLVKITKNSYLVSITTRTLFHMCILFSILLDLRLVI